MSISRWVSPVLSFAVPVVVIIAILSFFVTPWVASKGNEFQAQIKSKDDLASISPGVFKESQDANRVFFIESFDNLGNEVKNIFVQSSEKGKKSVIVAAKGYREKHANGDEFVVMEKGRRYEIEKNSAAVNTTEFERYGIRVQHKKVAVAPPSSQALSSLDLLQNRSNSNIAELHNRISLPLSSLILALLAIPLSYVDQRSGRSTNFMMAIMIFLIYNNLLNIMQAWLIQEKISLLIGMWPIHVLFIFFVGYLFYRRVNQKPFLPGMAS
jgi:lipopolysaccharide export system permease protein